MTKNLERIDSICKHNSILHKLLQRAHYLEHLNYLLQQALPTQYSAHCRLANIKGTTLLIHTDNAAFASLVRFQAPILCKTLSAKLEHTFDTIEVKVNNHYIPLQSSHSNPVALSDSATKALHQMARYIDNGPLKAALNKLAKR